MQLTFDRGTLLLRVPAADRVTGSLTEAGWKWDHRIPGWRCDAWRYRGTIDGLAAANPDLEDLVPAWEKVIWPQDGLPQLRPEQDTALAKWTESRQGIVIMPTGTGKTEVALAAMRATCVSTLIVAPVRDLMYQWHRRIVHGLGYDAGIVGDQIYRVKPVSVTTYDSACIHMHQLGNQFALIIFDECHHLPGQVRSDAARMSAAPYRMGLTATLERSDGRHADLVQWIGPTVHELTLANVRGSTLANYEVIRIPVFLQADEQSRYDALSLKIRQFMAYRSGTSEKQSWQDVCANAGSDPQSREIMRALRMKQAIEDRAREKLRVLEDLFRLHAGTPIIVFAGSNAMAREVSRRFLIPCLLNHCGKHERLDALDGLNDGRYSAVVANQVLDEGVDIPAVKVGIVLGGTASTRQSRQRLGRILRRVGDARAALYEVVCAETREVNRSRKRRSTDAFQGTRHRRI
ncbi:MAG: DEAD/DEAH box helicase family protein [Planctomycetota bacterium]|nr:DEAD/DEAH box helicase family protein [Planctomycetota bacterium]